MHRPKTLTRTFLFLSGLLLASSLARADGPSLVKDIVPGPTGSNPFYLTSVGERVVFWTYDYSSPTYPYYAYHLWASDGTDAGTVKLADVGYYTAFQQFSGDVYVFTAYDYSTSTYQKWRTDGTPAGTYKLFDGTINFQLLVGGVRIGWGSVYNSTTSTYAYSLWRTDGTLAGTQLLQSFSSGESPSVVSMLGDILIFQTTKYNSATSNYDTSLWRTDGTAGGTTLLRTAQGSIASATVLGSTLVYWFYTYAGGTYQYAIWRTDGTAAGTFLLKSTGSSGVNSRKPAFENALYFFVKTGSTGVELWRTDGSTGGTTLLKSAVGTNFAFLAPAFGNALLYTVYSSTTGYALWRTDGTPAGTLLLANTGGTNIQLEANLVGGLLHFRTYSSASGVTFWRTDGTAEGTISLRNAPGAAYASTAAIFGNLLVFWSYRYNTATRTYEYTLWRSDGTVAGTFALLENTSYYSGYLQQSGGLLYFWSYVYNSGPGTYEYSLWRTDGTAAGTALLKTLPAGETFAGTFIPFGQLLLFWTYHYNSTTGTYDYSLWRTDGSAAATFLLANVGASGSNYTALLGDVLVFWIYSATGSHPVWRTDGTAAGTYPLRDVGTVGQTSSVYSIATVGSRLIFYAYTYTGTGYTYATWMTDGTAPGTVLLGNGYAYGRYLGSVFLFYVSDGSTGDLWRTDGTDAGTYRLAQGSGSASYLGSASYTFLDGNSLLFSSYAAATGFTLWRSDATVAGTQALKSGFSGIPYYFARAGDVVLFSAAQPATGQELWRLDGDGGAPAPAEVQVSPAFTRPTDPADGSSFAWAAGKRLAFDVSAFDPNAGDVVTLSARSVPAGATFTPSLPRQGNPVQASFAWTPTAAEAGERVIELVASDGEREATYRITVTVNVDSDGDGLLDLWETPSPAGDGGYTLDGVFVDLVAMGANPRRKDVFVEVDYMADATRSMKPGQASIDRIVAMFADAPLSNPDGSRGISLHVRIDGAVPWSDLLGTTGGSGYSWTDFDKIKEANFDGALRLSTHYCVFAYRLPNGLSGLSRGNGAADFIVALGILPTSYNREWAEAGTFAHELGHNLGLMHGGGDDLRNKPNYLSVMNPSFQLRGLRRYGADGYFDYSREALPDLDERNLDETKGVYPTVAGLQTTFWAAFKQLWSAGLPVAVDWNANGTLTVNVVGDLNNDFVASVLRGWNDWPSLNFTGGSLGAGVVLEEPESTPVEKEVDETEAQQSKPAGPTGLAARVAIGSVRLSWNTCGAGLTYNVYRWVGDETPTRIATVDRALHTDTSGTKGVTYKYAVTVVNGNESDLSGSVSALWR